MASRLFRYITRPRTFIPTRNQANGHYSSVLFGFSNRALGYGSVVAGGHYNTVGLVVDVDVNKTDTLGWYAFVGAGVGNQVRSESRCCCIAACCRRRLCRR
jgi:hypothetical protein